MYSGRAKSNDAARNQVRAGENVSPQAHIKAIETDQWMHPEVQEYRNVKDELLVYQGTELRGNRIVVPKVLRDKAVNLAHVGYQGIAKPKRLIRQIIWFPAIEKTAKVKKVDSCLPYQAATISKAERFEPLRMTLLPNIPWKELTMDVPRPLPCGEYLTVVIDKYSCFPEVEIVTSTSAKSTISRLIAIFSRQGIPDVLKSDNGPLLMAWSWRTLLNIWVFTTENHASLAKG